MVDEISLENLRYKHKRNELLIIGGIIFISIFLIFFLLGKQQINPLKYTTNATTPNNSTVQTTLPPSISLTPLSPSLLQEINGFPASDLISFAKGMLN
ncbi:MAG: hypothetical protein ACP5RE_04245, partial [Candidatus Acidifodinimicrobium sp.]